MLGVVSYNNVGSDIDIHLSDAEIKCLSDEGKVSGMCMYQSSGSRKFSDFQLESSFSVPNFYFNPPRGILSSISIPKRSVMDLVNEKKVGERCNYGMDGTKIGLSSLTVSNTEGLSLLILMDVGIILARQENKDQSEEQDVVEGLFKDLTDKEKKIIFDILNP